jgi:HPr kinase/phosphorylase
MMRIRGSCIAVDGHGVLLRGASGAGKSDLALRLVADGALLVSDDYTEVAVVDGRLQASAPEPIRGLLEVRGLGVLRMDAAPCAIVVAAIDLVLPESVPRMPDDDTTRIAGVALPRVRLAPFEASAVAKVRLVVRLATHGIIRVP